MGFSILGMNVGGTARDYSLLLRQEVKNTDLNLQAELNEYDTIQSQKASPEKGQETSSLETELEKKEQDILSQLQMNKNEDLSALTEVQKSNLAKILFTKGLDLVEDRLVSNSKEMENIIDAHSDLLKETINSMVKDDIGVDRFKETYPLIYQYLSINHPTFVSKLVPKKSIFGTIFEMMKNVFFQSKSPDITGSPLDRQLQSLKDRLAINYFEKLVQGKQRPGVITLQELQPGKEMKNQHIVDILGNAGYQIFTSRIYKMSTQMQK